MISNDELKALLKKRLKVVVDVSYVDNSSNAQKVVVAISFDNELICSDEAMIFVPDATEEEK